MNHPLSRATSSGLAAAFMLTLLGCSQGSSGGSGAGAGFPGGGGTGGLATHTAGGVSSGGSLGSGNAGSTGSSSSNAGAGGGGPSGGSTAGSSTTEPKDAGSTSGGHTVSPSTQAGSISSGRGDGGPLGGQGGIRDAGAPDGGGGGQTGGGSSAGGTTSSSAGGTTGFTPCPGASQTLSVGSGQTYTSVQAALNAVSSSNSKWVQINVKAGTYKEQVTINKPFVCLVGESPTTTTISFTIDNNILTGGTVLLKANDFSAANIAFENTHGKGESGGQNQAVALMAQGQRQQFRNCRFLSYQDTLYTNTGTQYFRDCFIQGSVDYIFGDATAVFEDCTMHNIAEGTAVTAPRTPQNTPYGFVFLGGTLTAASGVRSNKVNLGRPWGPYAAAAFLNVSMGAHITTEGWTTMSDNTLAQTRFSEYKSTGAGASTSSTTRSSRQLSDAQAANYTVGKVLGSWTPGYSK